MMNVLHKRLLATMLSAVAVAGFWSAAASAELPSPSWSDDILVVYSASHERKLSSRRMDSLTVYRDGTATLARHRKRTQWRMMCLGDRAMKRVRRRLRRARHLNEERTTQPYPVEGRQAIVFGKHVQHTFRTLPDDSLPPMRGKRRRKLFRHMESLRDRTWDSTRTRPCN